jgi:hypothetical protein
MQGNHAMTNQQSVVILTRAKAARHPVHAQGMWWSFQRCVCWVHRFGSSHGMLLAASWNAMELPYSCHLLQVLTCVGDDLLVG